MEVTVAGFGPDHRLWPRFTEQAMARGEQSFHWMFPDAADRTRHSPQIRAVVPAASAEAAVKRVIRVIREVGRSIDRYGEVAWDQVEATCYRL